MSNNLVNNYPRKITKSNDYKSIKGNDINIKIKKYYNKYFVNINEIIITKYVDEDGNIVCQDIWKDENKLYYCGERCVDKKVEISKI